MDLEKALEQFDAVDANLRRLQAIWTEMEGLIPAGIAFIEAGPEGQRYRELTRAYSGILEALPAIAGYRVEAVPWDLDGIAQARLDAKEIGEFTAELSVEEGIGQPGREIEEYTFRLTQTRRELIRDQLIGLMSEIDGMLADLSTRVPAAQEPISDEGWQLFLNAFAQLERLTGNQVPRKGRWSDLHRHMSFALGVDLHDIATLDWPSVRSEIQKSLYSELEAVPVDVDDLASVVESKPSGVVTTKLSWSSISAEDFERLIFNLITEADDYANPKWLMHTKAPDRGRDISADHIRTDSLGDSILERVIIQARHWRSRSIGTDEVAKLLAQMELWEPPVVHVLVIATSGRFSVDAVDWIERHNVHGKRPRIAMWADSHLELLLARRSHLAAAFNLR